MSFRSLMLTAAIYSAVTLTSANADILFYCGDNAQPSITIKADGSAIIAEDYEHEKLSRIVITGYLPTNNFGQTSFIFKGIHNAFMLKQQQDITIEIKDIAAKADYKKAISYIVPNVHRIKKLTISNVNYNFMTDLSAEIAKHGGGLFTDDIVVEFNNLSYNNGGWWYSEKSNGQTLLSSMLATVSFKKQDEKQWFGDMAGLINKLQNVKEFTISQVSPSFMNCLTSAFSARENNAPFLKTDASFTIKNLSEADTSNFSGSIDWTSVKFEEIATKLKGISNLTIYDVSAMILQQISAKLKNSNALNDGCVLVLQDILNTTPDSPMDVKDILFNVSDFTINFTKTPGYVYVSDYSGTKLANLTIKGDTCWSDLKDFEEHHGGFLTVLKVPSPLKMLRYEATPWSKSVGYLGYSGLALYTENISSEFKLTMTPLVSAFYLVLPEDKWDSFIDNTFPHKSCDFLSLDMAKALGTVTVPSGPFSNVTCYQPDTKKRFFYITNTNGIQEILNSKSISNSDALQPVGGNGKITVDDAKAYQSQDRRSELINTFNKTSSGETIDLTQSTIANINDAEKAKKETPKESGLKTEQIIVESEPTVEIPVVQPKIVTDSTPSTSSSPEYKSKTTTTTSSAEGTGGSNPVVTPTGGSEVPPPPSISVRGTKAKKPVAAVKTTTGSVKTGSSADKKTAKPATTETSGFSADQLQAQRQKLKKTSSTTSGDKSHDSIPAATVTLKPVAKKDEKKISKTSKTAEDINPSAVNPTNPPSKPAVETKETKPVIIETPIAQPKVEISSSSPSEAKSESPKTSNPNSTTVGEDKDINADKVEGTPELTEVKEPKSDEKEGNAPIQPAPIIGTTAPAAPSGGIPPVLTNVQPPKTISAPVVTTNSTAGATRRTSAPAGQPVLSLQEQIANKLEQRGNINLTDIENKIQQNKEASKDSVDSVTAALRDAMSARRVGMEGDSSSDDESSSEEWSD